MKFKYSTPIVDLIGVSNEDTIRTSDYQFIAKNEVGDGSVDRISVGEIFR